MDFQTLFKTSMDRDLPELDPISGDVLNLGSGNKSYPFDCTKLDYPDWDADLHCTIPFDDETYDHVVAFHFLEHVKDPIKIISEVQRVLKSGGIFTICVPYYTSQMQAHDLDHKSQFCEETWRNLFSTPYYDKNTKGNFEWKFDIKFNLICGVVERNLCLLTQLQKID